MQYLNTRRNLVGGRWYDLHRLNQRIEIMTVADARATNVLDGTDHHWTQLLPGLNSSSDCNKRNLPFAASSYPTKKFTRETQSQKLRFQQPRKEMKRVYSSFLFHLTFKVIIRL
jgi:hypothetical protein